MKCILSIPCIHSEVRSPFFSSQSGDKSPHYGRGGVDRRRQNLFPRLPQENGRIDCIKLEQHFLYLKRYLHGFVSRKM